MVRDIAIATGSRANLAALTRTESGQFKLKDALNLEDWQNPNPDDIRGALRPIDEAVFASLSIPVRYVDEKTAAAMRHGKPLVAILRDEDSVAQDGDLSAVFCGGSLTALIENRPPAPPNERKSACWRYVFVV